MQFHDDYDGALNSKYYLAGKRLGAPTSPFTPKQLEEFGKRLNEGIQNVEIGTIEPEKFETIPEEHFREIKRLSKITNSHISMHSPLIEPSGFEKEGWSEEKRIANEKQIGNVLERAGELGENIPVVLHGSNTFGQQWEKGLKTQEGEESLRAMTVVNEDNGKIIPLAYEKKQRLLTERERDAYKLKKGEETVIFDPKKKLDSLNQNEWDRETLDLFKFQRDIDDIDDKINRKAMENLSLQKSGLLREEEQKSKYIRNERDIRIMQGHTEELHKNLKSHFDDAYNKIKKFSPEKYKDYNIKILNDIKENHEKLDKEIIFFENEFKKELSSEIKKARNKEEAERIRDILLEKFSNQKIKVEEEKSKNLLSGLQRIQAPEVWKPVKDFAIEKASETIANAALSAYKKFGDKAPVIAVENSYPEMPLSRAEDLRKGIEEARRKFSEKLVKEKNIPKENAKEIAKKLIGATWDIGHINLLRRAGYSEQELKDLIKEETKSIASLVKHVHITDNFGFNDSHLPPGMGNVPVKELLEELEKKGWTGRGIIEAGNFVKEFETSPFPHTLEYFESPISSIYGGFKQDIYGSSFGTYIDFPKQHFDMYGSGFSTLPKELGGETGGGEKSRFMQEE